MMKNVKEIQINEDDKVWLRDFIAKAGTSRKFHQPWKGPYKVVRVVGENNLDIELKTGKIKGVTLEQVKLVTEIDGSPQDIVKVHDKFRSRLPGQRLTTRYFVEFYDCRTQ